MNDIIPDEGSTKVLEDFDITAEGIVCILFNEYTEDPDNYTPDIETTRSNFKNGLQVPTMYLKPSKDYVPRYDKWRIRAYVDSAAIENLQSGPAKLQTIIDQPNVLTLRFNITDDMDFVEFISEHTYIKYSKDEQEQDKIDITRVPDRDFFTTPEPEAFYRIRYSNQPKVTSSGIKQFYIWIEFTQNLCKETTEKERSFLFKLLGVTFKVVVQEDSGPVELGQLLSEKAELFHIHDVNEITNLDSALTSKADVNHVHAISDIEGLEERLPVVEVIEGLNKTRFNYIYYQVDESDIYETNNVIVNSKNITSMYVGDRKVYEDNGIVLDNRYAVYPHSFPIVDSKIILKVYTSTNIEPIRDSSEEITAYRISGLTDLPDFQYIEGLPVVVSDEVVSNAVNNKLQEALEQEKIEAGKEDDPDYRSTYINAAALYTVEQNSTCPVNFVDDDYLTACETLDLGTDNWTVNESTVTKIANASEIRVIKCSEETFNRLIAKGLNSVEYEWIKDNRGFIIGPNWCYSRKHQEARPGDVKIYISDRDVTYKLTDTGKYISSAWAIPDERYGKQYFEDFEDLDGNAQKIYLTEVNGLPAIVMSKKRSDGLYYYYSAGVPKMYLNMNYTKDYGIGFYIRKYHLPTKYYNFPAFEKIIDIQYLNVDDFYFDICAFNSLINFDKLASLKVFDSKNLRYNYNKINLLGSYYLRQLEKYTQVQWLDLSSITYDDIESAADLPNDLYETKLLTIKLPREVSIRAMDSEYRHNFHLFYTYIESINMFVPNEYAINGWPVKLSVNGVVEADYIPDVRIMPEDLYIDTLDKMYAVTGGRARNYAWRRFPHFYRPFKHEDGEIYVIIEVGQKSGNYLFKYSTNNRVERGNTTVEAFDYIYGAEDEYKYMLWEAVNGILITSWNGAFYGYNCPTGHISINGYPTEQLTSSDALANTFRDCVVEYLDMSCANFAGNIQLDCTFWGAQMTFKKSMYNMSFENIVTDGVCNNIFNNSRQTGISNLNEWIKCVEPPTINNNVSNAFRNTTLDHIPYDWIKNGISISNAFDSTHFINMNTLVFEGDFPNCENLSSLFIYAKGPSEVVFQNINAPKCSNISSMMRYFNQDSTYGKDWTFRSSNVKFKEYDENSKAGGFSCEAMFCECKKCTSIDIRDFPLNDINNFTVMFKYTNKHLTKLLIGEIKPKCLSAIFSGMFEDSIGENTELDFSFAIDYAPTGAAFDSFIKNCYLSNSNFNVERFMNVLANNAGSLTSAFEYCTMKKPYFPPSNSLVTDMNYLYRACTFTEDSTVSIGTVDECYVYPNVNNIYDLFNESNITDAIVNSEFPKATSARWMFANCKSLKNINIVRLYIPKATEFHNVFNSSDKLFTIDLSNVVLGTPCNCNSLCINCSSLEELSLSDSIKEYCTNFDSAGRNTAIYFTNDLLKGEWKNVTSIFELFSYCSNVKQVNIEGMNLYKPINIKNIYRNSSNLVNPQGLQSFIDRHANLINSMQEVFYEFKGVIRLFLPTMLNNTSFYQTFVGSNIRYVELHGEYPNLTTCYRMFRDSQVRKIVFRKFKAVKCTDCREMFSNCLQLESIDFSGWELPNVTNVAGLFNGAVCSGELINLKRVWQQPGKKLDSINSMFANVNMPNVIIDLVDILTNCPYIQSTAEMFINATVKDIVTTESSISLPYLTTCYRMFRACKLATPDTSYRFAINITECNQLATIGEMFLNATITTPYLHICAIKLTTANTLFENTQIIEVADKLPEIHIYTLQELNIDNAFRNTTIPATNVYIKSRNTYNACRAFSGNYSFTELEDDFWNQLSINCPTNLSYMFDLSNLARAPAFYFNNPGTFTGMFNRSPINYLAIMNLASTFNNFTDFCNTPAADASNYISLYMDDVSKSKFKNMNGFETDIKRIEDDDGFNKVVLYATDNIDLHNLDYSLYIPSSLSDIYDIWYLPDGVNAGFEYLNYPGNILSRESEMGMLLYTLRAANYDATKHPWRFNNGVLTYEGPADSTDNLTLSISVSSDVTKPFTSYNGKVVTSFKEMFKDCKRELDITFNMDDFPYVGTMNRCFMNSNVTNIVINGSTNNCLTDLSEMCYGTTNLSSLTINSKNIENAHDICIHSTMPSTGLTFSFDDGEYKHLKDFGGAFAYCTGELHLDPWSDENFTNVQFTHPRLTYQQMFAYSTVTIDKFYIDLSNQIVANIRLLTQGNNEHNVTMNEFGIRNDNNTDLMELQLTYETWQRLTINNSFRILGDNFVLPVNGNDFYNFLDFQTTATINGEFTVDVNKFVTPYNASFKHSNALKRLPSNVTLTEFSEDYKHNVREISEVLTILKGCDIKSLVESFANGYYPNLKTINNSFRWQHKSNTDEISMNIYNFNTPVLESINTSLFETINTRDFNIFYWNLKNIKTFNPQICIQRELENVELGSSVKNVTLRGLELNKDLRINNLYMFDRSSREAGNFFIDPDLMYNTKSISNLFYNENVKKINSHEWVFNNCESFSWFLNGSNCVLPNKIEIGDLCSNPNITNIYFTRILDDPRAGGRHLIINASSPTIINFSMDIDISFDVVEYLQLHGIALSKFPFGKDKNAIYFSEGTDNYLGDTSGYTVSEYFIYNPSIWNPPALFKVIFCIDGVDYLADIKNSDKPFIDLSVEEPSAYTSQSYTHYRRKKYHLDFSSYNGYSNAIRIPLSNNKPCRVDEIAPDEDTGDVIVNPEYLWDGLTQLTASFPQNTKSIYFERGCCTTLTSLAYAFANLPEVEAIDISNLLRDNCITDFTGAFSNCPKLRTVVMKEGYPYHTLETYPTINFTDAFRNSPNIEQPGLASLMIDMAFVTGFNSMFSFSSDYTGEKVYNRLKLLDLTNWLNGSKPDIFYFDSEGHVRPDLEILIPNCIAGHAMIAKMISMINSSVNYKFVVHPIITKSVLEAVSSYNMFWTYEYYTGKLLTTGNNLVIKYNDYEITALNGFHLNHTIDTRYLTYNDKLLRVFARTVPEKYTPKELMEYALANIQFSQVNIGPLNTLEYDIIYAGGLPSDLYIFNPDTFALNCNNIPRENVNLYPPNDIINYTNYYPINFLGDDMRLWSNTCRLPGDYQNVNYFPDEMLSLIAMHDEIITSFRTDTTLDFSKIDLSGVKSASGLFAAINTGSIFNVYNVNANRIIDASEMFALSVFDRLLFTDDTKTFGMHPKYHHNAESMFRNVDVHTDILDLSDIYFKFNDINQFNNMFYMLNKDYANIYCESYNRSVVVIIPNIDFSAVPTLDRTGYSINIFYGACIKELQIYNWQWDKTVKDDDGNVIHEGNEEIIDAILKSLQNIEISTTQITEFKVVATTEFFDIFGESIRGYLHTAAENASSVINVIFENYD